ncbi:MAG: 2-oxo acid dehydrogenase subunit E2 [Myxococcales bacterium]|nr:2-oxo acid dehydrogenase subunit E2 [Myxococcales bacterium]
MITMPALGESVAEGEIGKWLVREGERVEKDQPLVEVLTDKADSEIPASATGVVTKIFASVGDVVSVGENLCEIDANAEASDSGDGASKGAAATPSQGEDQPKSTKKSGSSQDAAPAEGTSRRSSSDDDGTDGTIHASPAVRKLAREQNIDLTKISTSAPGRISMEDVRRAADGGGGEAPRSQSARSEPQPPADQRDRVVPRGAFKLPPYTPRPGDEVIPFTRRRRIIADHMVYSKLNAPHVVTQAECDLHLTAKMRDQHKGEFKAAGLNLTYLAFVAAATARALTEYRELNSRVMDDAYVLLRDVNLGIAVDTPEGLVVPVLRGADELSVRGIARGIDELATKAREGKLAPDDLANKTFTISNPGRKGNLVGGAIISQPNVGILRIGEIKKRVVVVEREDEDLLAIHPVMYMALSYDHRVVDGVHANAFLWRINQLLEEADFEI